MVKKGLFVRYVQAAQGNHIKQLCTYTKHLHNIVSINITIQVPSGVAS